MARLKNEAEHLRFGILGGWLNVEEAVAWADGQIAQNPAPHPALLDVALARPRSRKEVATLLAAVPGTANMTEVMRWCLADLLEVVEREPDAARNVARWLEVAAHEGRLPESEFGWEPRALADEFAMAEQAVYGTVPEARQRLFLFLRTHGGRRIMISTRVAPQNSLVLVEDASGGTIADPELLRRRSITSTDSCVAISCLNWQDGETEITLGSTREVDPGSPHAFRGTLKTPTRRVVVRSVLRKTILELPVPHQETAIRVWVNHPREPDCVIVGLG